MSKIFALLAVLLILTGAVLIAVPREQPATTRGPNVQQVVTAYTQVRNLAEQVNAPLSILFGLISLFYSRRTYLAQKHQGDGHGKGRN